MEISGEQARVELGEGIQGTCRITAERPAKEKVVESKVDLASLSSRLKAHWKGGDAAASEAKPEAARAGQIRSFRIAKLDPAAKKIELDLT
jgi:small subunit ribosomal protein S1